VPPGLRYLWDEVGLHAGRVGINGPATLGENTYCTWYALVAGGQPPYSYVWRHNGSIAGTAEFYSVGPAGNQNFQLQITVTDGVGRVTSNYLNITIDPYNTQFQCV
jgi:hypothetical protein